METQTETTETSPRPRSNKRQTEIPGAERPTIPELDELCAADLDAVEERERAKQKAKDAYAPVKAAMLERRETLPKDSKGRALYVYRDGEKSVAYRVSTKYEVTREVLEDGGDPDEIG